MYGQKTSKFFSFCILGRLVVWQAFMDVSEENILQVFRVVWWFVVETSHAHLWDFTCSPLRLHMLTTWKILRLRSSSLIASELFSKWGLCLLILEHFFISHNWNYFSYYHICPCSQAKYFGIGSNFISLISWKFACWNQPSIYLNCQLSSITLLSQLMHTR
jgi:hypothetical protein